MDMSGSYWGWPLPSLFFGTLSTEIILQNCSKLVYEDCVGNGYASGRGVRYLGLHAAPGPGTSVSWGRRRNNFGGSLGVAGRRRDPPYARQAQTRRDSYSISDDWVWI